MSSKTLIILFLLSIHVTQNLAMEMDPFESEDEQCAYQTALEQSTFTVEVDTLTTQPFFAHFTNHFLPLSQVSIHTQNLLEQANTVVIEPRPLEDEPLNQIEKAYEVFRQYCIDSEFHAEFQNYMKSMHYPYYLELKEKFEEAKDNAVQIQHPLERIIFDFKFEVLSPAFISYMYGRILLNKEKEKGMDNEVDHYALEHKKTRAGLDSVLENFILWTPKRLSPPNQISLEQKNLINQQLYAQLYYSKHPQAVEEFKNNGENLDKHTLGAAYENGQFFQECFYQDQMNSQGDKDCVKERNPLWDPRIEEITCSPERYLPPVTIFMGVGHHDILRLFEEKGWCLKILNRSGAWYPFSYTKLYQRFKAQKSS